MPTLSRFLVTLAVIVAVVYGAMFALVAFVKPRQAEMVVPIQSDKLDPKPTP